MNDVKNPRRLVIFETFLGPIFELQDLQRHSVALDIKNRCEYGCFILHLGQFMSLEE